LVQSLNIAKNCSHPVTLPTGAWVSDLIHLSGKVVDEYKL
jgi:hypothetical protein